MKMHYSVFTFILAFISFWVVQFTMATPAVGRAVVGIDYGTTNVRMGMLRSGVGSVEIVLSFESDRKTINAVAYREESSLFSQTAMNMFPKFPKAVYCRLNMLLGKLFNSHSVKEYRETFVHEVSEDPVRKTVLIAEPINGHLVPIEQIAATFFTHLMDQAEKHAGFRVVDCVISVPSYFDHFERQAVLDSAKIAGFNVLSLINSVSAAALFKTTTSNDLTTATNFIIYDSGSGGTSAALVTIDPKKTIDGVTAKSMEILGLESDAGLGGDLIDDRIASFLISKFEATNPGVKVTSGKPRNKILIEASRLKRILNANDRATASLEDLVEDYGMSSSVSREDIDNLLMDLAPRYTAPVTNLLNQNKMTIDQISAILLIGGNSRHQFLLKSLKGAFGADKLSVTLDPDEAIVKGSTLYSAKLHPAFRLRPTHFMDISPSGLYVQYRELLEGEIEGDLKRVELFPNLSPLQNRKSLTLKKINSVLVDFFYSRSNQKIGSIIVRGFNEAVEKIVSSGKTILSSKMRIPVLLSSSGHVVIETPLAAVEYEETVSKKVYKTHSNTATATATATNSDAAEPTSSSSETQTATTTTTTTTDKAPKVEVSVETQTVSEKVKRSKSYELPNEIKFEIPAMEIEAIKASQKIIEAAREKEFEKARVANARNDLEKAVYRLQGELNSADFLTYISNSEKSNAKNQLNKVTKFISEESNENLTEEIYLNHLNELIKTEIIVKYRQKEEEDRPVAIENLQNIINSALEFAQSQKEIEAKERPQSDEELEILIKKSQEFKKWLQEKIKKQGNSAKNIEPILLTSELKEKSEDLKIQLAILKSKKKPIPKPEPKNETPDNEKKINKPETEETKPETEETKPETEETKPETEKIKPETEEIKPETEEIKPETEETKAKTESDSSTQTPTDLVDETIEEHFEL